MPIDEIKPLLVLLVALIGLRVVLVGALKALTGQRATSTAPTAPTAPRLDPAPFLARGQHGAEWAHSPSGGWERVDEGAVPPIDYPPGETP